MNFDLTVQQGELNVQSNILFSIGDFPVTNSMLAGIVLTIFIIIFSIFLARNTKQSVVPSKFQILVELMYEIFLGFISSVAGSKKVGKRILSIIGTVFIYIGISNILTLFPILDSLTYELPTGEIVSLLRTHTSDINATFGIAASIVLWTQAFSIQKKNIFKHLNQYIRIGYVYNGFKKGIGDGLISLIDLLLLGPLDLISEIAKSLSLSLRLFGNMLAGLILGSIVLGALALFAPIPLILYGVFTGILQALVFGALSASYFGSALAEE